MISLTIILAKAKAMSAWVVMYSICAYARDSEILEKYIHSINHLRFSNYWELYQ